MQKKSQLTKQLKEIQKSSFFRRVLQGLFLSRIRTTRRLLSYLKKLREICRKSDVCFLVIALRYDKLNIPADEVNGVFWDKNQMIFLTSYVRVF